MSKEKTVEHNYRFVGFLQLLTLLFVGLKLGQVGVVASWSWWWVLSPLLIPLAITLIFIVLAIIWVFLNKRT